MRPLIFLLATTAALAGAAACAWDIDPDSAARADDASARSALDAAVMRPVSAETRADAPRAGGLQALVDPMAAQVPRTIMDWRTGAMILSRSGHSIVDRMADNLEDIVKERPVAPLLTPAPAGRPPVREAAFVHDGPVLSVRAGGFAIEFQPHASLLASTIGRVAEAGGTVRLGPAARTQRHSKLARISSGEGSIPPAAGHWYLFAGVSRRSVNWRAIQESPGGDRPLAVAPVGRAAEYASGFFSSAQAGVAWTEGALNAALALVRRDATYNGPRGNFQPPRETVVAFTISLKPRSKD